MSDNKISTLPSMIARYVWRGGLWLVQNLWLLLERLWLAICPQHRYVQAVNQFIKRNIAKHESTFTFLKTFALNPRTTGAVFPSSKYLANKMVSYVKSSEEGLVVELGAGTGVVTEAMLLAGIAPQRIIAVEYVPHLARRLSERFPDIEVIEGNAIHLDKFLAHKARPLDTIISSLPLRSLKKSVRETVLEQIPAILAPDGRYIQFTYDIRSDASYYPSNYILQQSAIVWRNIPSAKVEMFTFSDTLA